MNRSPFFYLGVVLVFDGVALSCGQLLLHVFKDRAEGVEVLAAVPPDDFLRCFDLLP